MESRIKSLQGKFACLLVGNLLAPAPPAAARTVPHAARPAYASTQLQGDARILHALDRFTFGPRPGDLDAVGAIGLDNWFEQQLHPDSIDESDLNARMASYPAMQWSTEDLLFRMPSGAIVRQTANGKLPMPRNTLLRAVYSNAIYRLDERKEARAEKAAAAEATPATMRQADAAAPDAALAAGASAAGADGMSPASSPASSAGSSAPAAAASLSVPDPQAMALAAKMDSLDDDPQTDALLALAPAERVARLSAMQPDEFAAFIQSLRPAQRQAIVAGMTPGLRETVGDLENPERLVIGELLADRLMHDIYSNAQLEQVMTDFWLNHFNIYLRKNEQMPYYLVSYERDVIRPRALGKFEDLLEAVAHSPAMLLYLDNAESTGPESLAAERAGRAAARNRTGKSDPPGLNENYGRELMELHTLGVNGGYTQADVIQAARILTGWTVDRPALGGGFLFNPNRHEPGTKKVMGQKFKESGEMEGRALLHFLATRPATARSLSRQLAIRFVSDDPPPALVDRMAKSYLSSGGDIPTVLRTLFHSPEFWAVGNDRAKVKTPLEFVVSAVRASSAQVENYEPLVNALRQMGMPLYGCVPPSGYGWDSATWVSTDALLERMNFAVALAANRFPGIRVLWNSESGQTAPETTSPEQEEARLEPMIVPGGIGASTRSAALQQFQAQIAGKQLASQAQPVGSARFVNRNNARPGARPGAISQQEREDQLLGGLLLGSPEFQRR